MYIQLHTAHSIVICGLHAALFLYLSLSPSLSFSLSAALVQNKVYIIERVDTLHLVKYATEDSNISYFSSIPFTIARSFSLSLSLSLFSLSISPLDRSSPLFPNGVVSMFILCLLFILLLCLGRRKRDREGNKKTGADVIKLKVEPIRALGSVFDVRLLTSCICEKLISYLYRQWFSSRPPANVSPIHPSL
jgi:hypothetical protein